MSESRPIAKSDREAGPAESDAAYWQRRAEEELELAQTATKPETVAAHYVIAEEYLKRAGVDHAD